LQEYANDNMNNLHVAKIPAFNVKKKQSNKNEENKLSSARALSIDYESGGK